MEMITLSRSKWRRLRPASFTLIELLTVMAIISILAGLILWAGTAMMSAANRSRARSEIGGMGQALENYKVDNGAYPGSSNIVGGTTGAYPLDPSVSGGNYQSSSTNLFYALTGQTNFAGPPGGAKSYYTFRSTQVGNYQGSSYVQDPYGFSYGYSTGDGTTANVPLSGTGLYDLWSTGGTTAITTTIPNPTNSWITNWKN